MKKLISSFLAIGLAALIGCDNKSTPGGPGATDSGSKKPIVGQADDTFTLSPPTLSTSLKQGETKSVSIGIKRGKNFDQDVSLKFEGMPKGVTIEPASSQIKHGESEAKISIKAADDAALDDHTIKVTGHPANGKDAMTEFKITVNKK
jgi:hypothetical protein